MSGPHLPLSTTVRNDSLWTDERIRGLVQSRFHKRPCWYQIQVAKAIYSGKDLIGCAPTGAGKTLSFWIPHLMAAEENSKKTLSFLVSPLNGLGKQHVENLKALGIGAISVTAENATTATFKSIEYGGYQVVVTNPEILLTNEDLKALWKNPKFTSRILSFIFDEGHCISQWGKFRKHYLNIGIIRYLIPDAIPFHVASATLPPPLILLF